MRPAPFPVGVTDLLPTEMANILGTTTRAGTLQAARLQNDVDPVRTEPDQLVSDAGDVRITSQIDVRDHPASRSPVSRPPTASPATTTRVWRTFRQGGPYEPLQLNRIAENAS